jgi:DNA-binding NtrC family response regulator
MTDQRKSLVFVVDDEQLISTTLASILEDSGFVAMAFVDPLEALRAAEIRCPDVLLTDVVMPELNGISLGIQFKAMYPDCHILLFSGQTTTSDLLKDANSKGHHFEVLAKPIHPRNLLESIRTIIAES